MAELKTISTAEEFEMLYKGSAYTVTGAGGPLEDWMTGITQELEKEKMQNISYIQELLEKDEKKETFCFRINSICSFIPKQ